MKQMQSNRYEGPVTAVRALIRRNGSILLMKKEGGGRGVRYALPGGKVDPGESLTDALLRECREEVDCPVMIGDLAYTVDLFRQRYSKPPLHQLEVIFHATVDDSIQPGNGPQPDPNQVALEWIRWDQLTGLNLVPTYLSACQNASQRYLGDFYQDDNAVT